jgi:anti-sigma factor ChrR (cupin superfamily)
LAAFLLVAIEILRGAAADPHYRLMHLREEDLKQYAMGTLPSSALRDFALHLLVCHLCQDRMAEMDAFVAAMRTACQEVEAPQVAPDSVQVPGHNSHVY